MTSRGSAANLPFGASVAWPRRAPSKSASHFVLHLFGALQPPTSDNLSRALKRPHRSVSPGFLTSRTPLIAFANAS